MRHRLLGLASIALLTLACDAGSAPHAAESSAARPPGWQSLEDESQAVRLYYQFVDERRQVRFVESLDDVPQALRAGVGFVKLAVPPPLSPGDSARARKAELVRTGRAPVARAHIVLYSADWCGVCRKAKRYLQQKGVDYEERNVDDPRYAQEVFEKTGERGIPVIEVDGRVLSGFSAQSYDRLIDRG